MFQINTDLVKVYEHINFLHNRIYNLPSFKRFSQNKSLFFPKAIGGLCHKGF